MLRQKRAPPKRNRRGVFRSAEDPNDVLILQDVADVAQARTWLGGDELKVAMTKAGVIGSPNVRFAS
jgi:hypothetical protein